MGTPDRPDLSRVAVEVEKYDRIVEARDAKSVRGLDKNVQLKIEGLYEDLLETQRRVVSLEFYIATSDRNCLDNCLLVVPGKPFHAEPSWLRSMLQKANLYSGVSGS